MQKTEQAQKIAAKLAFEILSLDKMEKEAKEKKEQRKAELTELCNSVYGDVFLNNQWELPEANAVIKIALNPHKVVDSRTGEAIKPDKRGEIAVLLADKYCTVDLNVKEIQASLELDKGLKSALNSVNVKIVQETRYDVKKLK